MSDRPTSFVCVCVCVCSLVLGLALQFVENGLHCMYMLVNETYSAVMAKFGVYYMVTLLILFGNFYIQKYLKSGGAKKKAN